MDETNEQNEEIRPLMDHSINSNIIFENSNFLERVFDPRRKFYRYFGLIFICLLTFGPYFCYVLPGALEYELESDLKISTSQFTLFVSLYSWPNIFLCLAGGYLIDRIFGIRFGAIFFSCVITLGQILFGYGAYINKVWLMDVGRFVFGIGGETVAIAQKAYLVAWFPSDELNFVFGFIASSALLGSSINQLVMEPIYKYINKNFATGEKCLGIAILAASIPVVGSTICAFILSPLDKRRAKILKTSTNKNAIEAKRIQLKDIIGLLTKLQFWLIITICIVFYSATFPFINLGKIFFIKKYQFSTTLSALQQSLFFFSTVATSPIFGKIVDATGYNLLWVIFSLILAILSHSLFLLTFVNSFIPVLVLGMSLSCLYASLWPMVALIIPLRQLGTAFGIMQSFQNLGLAVFTLLTGFIVENFGYFILELFFLDLCIFGLIFSLCLYFLNKIQNGNLCLSKKDLAQYCSSDSS